MLRLRRKARILAGDLALVVAVVVGYALLRGEPSPLAPLSLIAGLPVAFYLTGLYELQPDASRARPVIQILVACALCGMAVATLDHLLAPLTVSRRFLVGSLGAIALLLIPWRIFVEQLDDRLGSPRVPVVLYGGGAEEASLLEILKRDGLFEVRGVIPRIRENDRGRRAIAEVIRATAHRDGADEGWNDPGVSFVDERGNRAAGAGTAYGLSRKEVPTIVVSDPGSLGADDLDQLLQLRRQGIQVMELPEFWERATGRLPVFDLSDEWIAVHSGMFRDDQSLWARVKRITDVAGAALLLLVLAVPTALAALAHRITEGAPVFYRQTRIGKDGRPFRMFKLRTMRADADRTGPAWTLRGDERITPVGRLLRKLHLDEVPQLWNVTRGDMSLVGPRPEEESLARLYARNIPRYELRYLVKPGVTGWAQVRHGSTSSLEAAATKLEYDLYYVRKRSPVLDARILLKTVYAMMVGTGR